MGRARIRQFRVNVTEPHLELRANCIASARANAGRTASPFLRRRFAARLEHAASSGAQWRKVGLHDRPDRTPVDTLVSVRDAIAQANYLWPRNLRRFALRLDA